MSGEDSEHTLIQERMSTSMSGEGTPRSCVSMGENTSIPNGPSGVQGTLKVRKKDGDDPEGNSKGCGNVNKLKGASVVARKMQ